MEMMTENWGFTFEIPRVFGGFFFTLRSMKGKVGESNSCTERLADTS